jgi:hypothetical protein
MRERAGAGAGEETVPLVGGDAPILGCDFDDLARGIGEIDGDGARGERVAGEADAGEDFVARTVAEAGVGLKEADGVAHGVVGGEDAVLDLEAVGQPFAETVGCDGAGFVGEGGGRDGDPGVAGFGCERGGESHGVLEDLLGETGRSWHLRLLLLLLGGACQVFPWKLMRGRRQFL